MPNSIRDRLGKQNESSLASACAIVTLSGATEKEVVQFQYRPASSTTCCKSLVSTTTSGLSIDLTYV